MFEASFKIALALIVKIVLALIEEIFEFALSGIMERYFVTPVSH